MTLDGVKSVEMDTQHVCAVQFNHADRATCYFFFSCWFISILGSVNELPSAEYVRFRAAQSVQRSGFAKLLKKTGGKYLVFQGFLGC